MFTIIIIGPIMELTSGGGASQDPRETTIELELRSPSRLHRTIYILCLMMAGYV